MSGAIKVLDHTGHTTVEFDTDKSDTLVTAKELADRLERDGMNLYKVVGPGVAEQLKKGSFDPEQHSNVLAVPPMVGG